MTDVDTVVDSYIRAWNETDPDIRKVLVEQAFADDASYLDPLMGGTGRDEIAGLIAAVQEQYGDHRFKLVSGPDTHNDRVRFSWNLVPESGEPLVTGIDFGTLSEDGRLRSVTGFLEAPKD
jgi:hypothetical protein